MFNVQTTETGRFQSSQPNEANKPKIRKPCGNPECGCSTGIHEGLTFGSGELNDFGFWEKPCFICARHSDATMPSTLARLREEHKDKPDVDEYLKLQHPWLFIEAWPYAVTAAKS